MAKQSWREELSDWIASLRFSGYTVLIVVFVIIGGLAVSPTLSTYVQQQRELAELRESVRLQRERVDAADAARAKWLDPAYVRAQARGRLFYVMPGEMQLSVIDDVVIPPDSVEQTRKELTAVETNWAQALAVSTLRAGLAAAVEPAHEDATEGDAAAAGEAATEVEGEGE